MAVRIQDRPVIYIRAVQLHDAPYYLAAAKSSRFASLNFPATLPAMEAKIGRSQRSFRGEIAQPGDREYVFTIFAGTGTEAVPVGTSTFYPKHGTPYQPHTAWDVIRNTKEVRGVSVPNDYLIFVLDHDGPAEVGAMVVHRLFQGRESVGRQVELMVDAANHSLTVRGGYGRAGSWIRFFWAALPHNRDAFRGRLCISEFLAPLNHHQDGRRSSPFYDALGTKFLGGRTYDEMDLATLSNRRLLTSHFPLVVRIARLPAPAQEVIGKVGEDTKPAVKLLTDVGFRNSGRIDVLDAGPHYVGAFDQNPIFTGARELFYRGVVEGESSASVWHYGFIARSTPTGEFGFEACAAPYCLVEGGLLTTGEVAETLRLSPDDEMTVSAFPG